MNPDNGTCDNEANPQVVVVVPPQLIKYLESLDQSSEHERNREIREQFRSVRCFQSILGTSTAFKLIYDKRKLMFHPTTHCSIAQGAHSFSSHLFERKNIYRTEEREKCSD